MIIQLANQEDEIVIIDPDGNCIADMRRVSDQRCGSRWTYMNGNSLLDEIWFGRVNLPMIARIGRDLFYHLQYLEKIYNIPQEKRFVNYSPEYKAYLEDQKEWGSYRCG